jgi:hypothetical protein
MKIEKAKNIDAIALSKLTVDLKLTGIRNKQALNTM